MGQRGERPLKNLQKEADFSTPVLRVSEETGHAETPKAERLLRKPERFFSYQ
jgi:hypothetical protein